MELNILLQTTVATSTTISTDQIHLIIFWTVVALCIILFIYFLKKTDKLVSQNEPIAQPIAAKKLENDKNPKGEEAAAIALAINLYKSQLHDMESLTITLKKVSRIYSPWSSKIYTLRQNPRH